MTNHAPSDDRRHAPWQRTAIVAALLLLGAMTHGPVQAQTLPDTSWESLEPREAQALLKAVEERLGLVPAPVQQAWENATGLPFESIPGLVPHLYNAAHEYVDQLPVQPTLDDVDAAIDAVVNDLAEDLTDLVPAPGSPQSPSAQCVSSGPLGALLIVLCPVYFVLFLVLLPVFIALGITMQVASATTVQVDSQADGIGDAWQEYWERQLGATLATLSDSDSDALLNVDEFRWELYPVCVGGLGGAVLAESFDFPNQVSVESLDPIDTSGVPSTPEQRAPTDAASPLCRDFDQDDWEDGPEWMYWNDPHNDALLVASVPDPLNGGAITGTAFFDPDRLLDSDGDTIRNAYDSDSDNDTIPDGLEIALGTYPEFPDSDCELAATTCTPSSQTSYYAVRTNNPGKGDGLSDAAELAAWNALGAAWDVDHDGDGIANNLLDPDADADTLLDGEEFLVWHTKPHLIDSDLDGLQDGDEVRAYHTDPADWDTDGDAMPDGWEAAGNLNPLVDDAALDPDADGLSNIGEYAYARPGGWDEESQGPWLGGTNPSDPDTEGDAIFDGEEVLTHSTDPHHWDTDLDGMADFFEVTYGFDPLSSGDAALDMDSDSFDQGSDGSIQLAWPNIEEYRYGRTAWDEVTVGPWRAGTDPLNPDTDGDGSGDGQEAYFGTNARVPADVLADEDGDGLTWADEANLGTNPSDPDSDGDGLCDGSRGANCRFPGLGSTGNMPGEQDYGAIAWDGDSDADGLSDSQEAATWDPGASGSGQDVDGDLLNGVIDSDSDNDGLTDGAEFSLATQMAVPDTDGDRLKDGDEVNYYATTPTLFDSDNDGLFDGDEIEAHHTRPMVWDTDGDSLSDGAEVNTHGTDPLLPDSDQDTLPDAWEVTLGTQARVADADQDPDADDLSNAREYAIGSMPMWADSDGSGLPPGDGLPDGYEDQYGLGVTSYNPSEDADGDGYTNLNEYNAKTHPLVADTDGDGRNDGWEALTAGTDPLDSDTDKDGLGDGAEFDAWTAKSYAWGTDHDGDSLNGLRDVDSDNDGLNDRDELVDAQTMPHDPDSDNDGLNDFQEVVAYGGQYDPNDPDTDNDGTSDSVEVALADTNGDFDKDGLKNGDEGTYGTDPTKEDTDCDGAKDGPEYQYWGASGNLLIADVDGDSLKDGIEIGTTGTPNQALYKTRPDVADTDGDGLRDDEEARNNVKVTCGNAQTQSTPFGASPLPTSVPTSSVPFLLAGLTQTTQGYYVGRDSGGWYVQGGYGVRLYVNASLASTATIQEVIDALGMQQQSSTAGGPAAGTNGKLTNPTIWDTDGDRLSDGNELNLQGTNPNVCDSDGDGLGDALELGIEGSTLDANNACTHLDSDPDTTTNPNNPDSDGDKRTDGVEDANRNGRADFTMDAWDYVAVEGETDPVTIDTDGDGIGDQDEIDGKNTINPSLSRGIPTLPFSFDSDSDGLSDGLELGVRNQDKTSGTVARTVTIFGHSLSTFQAYQGSGTSTLIPYSGSGDSSTTRDFDRDGVIDGLEDWNPNGLYMEDGYELNPTDGDVDDDGLMDGRELRVYGTYNFPTVMQQWGGSGSQLLFDSGNPWETNSRNEHSEGQSDDVPDGQDLNPRADAGLIVGLAGFRVKEKVDDCCGNNYKWNVDLGMKFTLDLPVAGGTYKTNTAVIQDLYARNPTDIDLTGRAENNQIPTALMAAYGGLNVLNFDLPDNVGSGVDLANLNIRLTLQAYDDDQFGAHDTLDLNENEGQADILQAYLLDSESPESMPADYMSWGGLVQHEGRGKHSAANGDIESSLSVKFGDTAPTYFITGLRQIRATGAALPPTGTCLGTINCT